MEHSARCSHDAGGTVDRSGLRDEGRSGRRRIAHSHEGHAYYLLLRRLPQQIHRRSGRNILARQAAKPAPPAPAGTIYTCPMHPQIRQVGPGSCPICGMALEPLSAGEETGPSAELIDMTRRFWIGAVLAVPIGHPGNGRALSGPQPSPLHLAASLGVGSISARDAGRAVGRLAVLRARLGVGAQSLAQHVQPDRARCRRRLCLQPCRHLRAGALPGELAAGRASSRSITKRPPSSPCSSCSARCWNCGRASRPAAPSAPCSTSRRKRRGASATTATTKRCRWSRSRSAIACACVPATACRWTASSSRAGAPSTNRW